MKVVFLDGQKIGGIGQVHEIFSSSLSFPDYYGKNLDALHDCLTDISDPVGVIIVNVKAFEKALGRRARGFFALMEDLANERENFFLLIDPFNETRV